MSRTFMRHTSLRWAATIVAASVIFGFAATNVMLQSDTRSGASRQGADDASMIAHADQILPDYSIDDWRNYSEHVVLAKATVSAKSSPSAEDQRNGEGVFLREITFTVKQTLWSNPAARGAAPKEFSVVYDGWHFGEGKPTVPFHIENTVDIQVGQQYLVPLTYFESDATNYKPLAPSSILPVSAGVVGVGGKYFNPAPTEALSKVNPRNRLSKLAVGEAIQALNADAPSLPTEFFDLPPVQRYAAVLAARADNGPVHEWSEEGS